MLSLCFKSVEIGARFFTRPGNRDQLKLGGDSYPSPPYGSVFFAQKAGAANF